MAQNMNNATVKELRIVAKNLGIKGYSKMTKAVLVAAIEKHKAAEVAAPVVEEPVVETVVEKKEVSDMKAKYNAAVWDKLVKALATEYVKQSLNRKWALFYKNTRATTTKSEYLVKSSRLWGCTAKVIKDVYGNSNCNESYIQQALNAMVVRGYLNYQKVNGKSGVNVIFNATKDQMNQMYRLSKQ